jgi:hypothetical protein
VSPRTRSALVRYLDKVRALYPAGISKSLLVTSSHTQAICSLVVIAPSGALNSEEEGLVESIRSKALKLDAERCVVVIRRSETELLHGELQTQVSIVFGASDALGSVSAAPSGVMLRTHSLSSMQQDPTIKREVWNHLKSVLPHISGG